MNTTLTRVVLFAIVTSFSNAQSAAPQPKLSVTVGHSEDVISVALSPDEKFVLTGGHDGNAILWDTSSGAEIRRFERDPRASSGVSEITTVSFSSDGKLILLAGSYFARLVDPTTGTIVRDFTPHDGSLADHIACVALLASNAHRVVVGNCFGNIRIYDADNTTELVRFKAHQDAVRSLAISEDQSSLLSGSGSGSMPENDETSDNSVRMWNLETAKELHSFLGHSGTVYAVAFLPDGKVATAAGDNTVRIWDATKATELSRFSVTPNVLSATFSKDGQLVLIGLNGGTAELYETRTGLLRRVFRGHKGVVSATALSSDGTKVLTGSWDNSAQLWDVRQDKLLYRFEGTRTPVVALRWSATSSSLLTLITGTPLNTITRAQLWDLSKGGIVKEFDLRGDDRAYQNLITFSPNGNYIAAAAHEDNAAVLFDHLGQPLRRFVGHSSPITSVAFSPDGKVLATGSGTPESCENNSDNSVRLWDVQTGRLIDNPTKFDCAVGTVAFSPSGRFLVSSSWYFRGGGSERKGEIQLWDIGTKREVWRRATECNWFSPVTFSNNEAWILGSDCFPKRPQVWNTRDGNDLVMPWDKPGGTGGGTPVFSARNELLTDSWSHYTLSLWDLAQKDRVREFTANGNSMVTCAAFSPSGELVAAGFIDGGVNLWHAETSQPFLHLDARSNVSSIAFSSDSHFLIAGTEDGRIQIWDSTKHDVKSETPLLTMIGSLEHNWAIAAGDGRFDSDDIEKLTRLSWIFPDSPLRALPAEIFMRDYYEPRLLSRFLSCKNAEPLDPEACKKQFQDIRPLADLNRIQPEVKILGVRRGASADEALVEVEALGKKDPTQPNHKTETAAYDLRLFRNGQLVGQWPVPQHGMAGPQDPKAWQQVSAVPTQTRTFPVRLAAKDRGQPVTFTAYAFNEDRVKSETTEPTKYTVPQDVPTRQAKAYVITIGINGYENPHRNLEFAVKDAQDMASALHQITDYGVVSVSLLSEAPKEGEAAPLNQATKAKIRAVLGVLAGRSDGGELNGVANAEKLAKATPDDLVILSFSGHGHTERNGAFYLLPSNSGKDDAVTATELTKFIEIARNSVES